MISLPMVLYSMSGFPHKQKKFTKDKEGKLKHSLKGGKKAILRTKVINDSDIGALRLGI